MPTTKEDLPDTLKRSPAKAQRTYAKALDAAHEEYESEERAHRVAFAALKHKYKKVGDHWEPKAGRNSSTSSRSGSSSSSGRRGSRTTKKELMDEARRLDVSGRSKMNRDQLARAVARAKR